MNIRIQRPADLRAEAVATRAVVEGARPMPSSGVERSDGRKHTKAEADLRAEAVATRAVVQGARPMPSSVVERSGKIISYWGNFLR